MSTQSIAIVNDDTVFLQLMAELLRDEGYSAEIMTISTEAFERIKIMQPDLVILDIWKKEADNGWEVLNLMRLHPPTSKIPVIVSSTDSADLEIKAPTLERLNCAVLHKPFDLEQLLEKVTNAIGPPED